MAFDSKTQHPAFGRTVRNPTRRLDLTASSAAESPRQTQPCGFPAKNSLLAFFLGKHRWPLTSYALSRALVEGQNGAGAVALPQPGAGPGSPQRRTSTQTSAQLTRFLLPVLKTVFLLPPDFLVSTPQALEIKLL